MDYKSSKWKRLREKVLRRDEYICLECKRIGKKNQATTVHHILPEKENPELSYNVENLYSCCDKCHNSFHDRITNKLTKTGIDLVKRKYPPTCSKIKKVAGER